MRRRRCLVPADGYYEWSGAEGRKVPFFVQQPDKGLFALAGLWVLGGDYLPIIRAGGHLG